MAKKAGGVGRHVTANTPRMFEPNLKERRYAHLRTVGYGASPIAVETLRQALDVFGCEFLQAYGQTEASAALTALGPEAHRRAVADEEHLLLSLRTTEVASEVAVS